MGSDTSSTSQLPAQGRFLKKGDTVGERFTVEGLLGPAVVGEYYLAADSKGDRPVRIHVLPAAPLTQSSAVDRFKTELRSAAQLTHKNILTTYGMGQVSPEAYYIAGEYVDGESLHDLMDERARAGRSFSLRGAYNIVAHLCNALAFAHGTRIHGSLSPDTVVVTESGRVKVSEFPLSRLLYSVPALKEAVNERARPYWAPEIQAGSTVITGRADIFSLGLMLHELLTGELPGSTAGKVSARRSDVPAEVDAIVARCLDPEPANRYPEASSLKEELATLLEKTVEQEGQEAVEEGTDLDIEIDVDRPLSIPPPPAPGKKPAAPPPPPGPPPPAAVKSSPGLPPIGGGQDEDEHRPSLGPLNLDEIMSSVKDQDSEKWMVTKEKMDHGPFRTREVIQMISRWEVEGHHLIQNIETGIRCKLRESDDFKELVERARIEKVKQEEQAALEQSEKAEKRGGVAKIFVVLIVVGAIGLIVGSIFAVRAITKSYDDEEADIDELIASGDLKIDMGQGGILKDKKGRRGGRRKGGGGGGGGGGGSYDDYMNQAVSMGDLSGDGGQTQLSQGQINAVMSSKGKVVYPCIYGELKRNPGLKKVSLKFAIEGSSGRVKGVTVTSGGSDEFKKCISKKMAKIKFPTFSAPRMGASFYFDVG